MLLAHPTCGFFTLFVDWLVAVSWSLWVGRYVVWSLCVWRCGSVTLGCCGSVVLCRLLWVGRCGLVVALVGRFVGWLLYTWHCWSGCGSVALCRSLCVGRFVSVAVGRLLLLNCSRSVNVGESQWFGRSRSIALGQSLRRLVLFLRALWISRCGLLFLYRLVAFI